MIEQKNDTKERKSQHLYSFLKQNYLFTSNRTVSDEQEEAEPLAYLSLPLCLGEEHTLLGL